MAFDQLKQIVEKQGQKLDENWENNIKMQVKFGEHTVDVVPN